MNPIRGAAILNRTIKETIWNCPEDNIELPRVIFYCGGIGEPTFKITIEKIDEDSFIDGNGQKWIKAKE